MKKFITVGVLVLIAFVIGNCNVRNWLPEHVPQVAQCTYTTSVLEAQLKIERDELKKQLLKLQVAHGKVLAVIQESKALSEETRLYKGDKALRDTLESSK